MLQNKRFIHCDNLKFKVILGKDKKSAFLLLNDPSE